MTDITMRQMLEAGVHFGHQVRFWNPKMAPYIFGTRNKIHIIDLEKTLAMYQQAINFLSSVAAKNGKILFVGTKQQARSLISAEAKRCHMPYVDFRWLGGMLTNYKTIRQSLKRLKELEELRDSPTFAQLPKKEALAIMREITKLERSLGGVREMGGLPDVVFIIDVGHEKIAVSEAAKLKIPIVGIVDTNNDPSGIDYVIPGNDDSIRAIKLYLQNIVDAIIMARSHIVAMEVIAEKEDKKNSNKPMPIAKKKVLKKQSITKGEKDEADGKTTVTGSTREAKAKIKTKITKIVSHKAHVIKSKSISKKKEGPSAAKEGHAEKTHAEILADRATNLSSEK